MLWVALGVVALVAGLLGWYAVYAARRFSKVSLDLGHLKLVCGQFTDHIKSVYEMETFYGDQTLEELLKHSKDVVGEIKILWEDYNLEDDYDEDRDEAEEETEE